MITQNSCNTLSLSLFEFENCSSSVRCSLFPCPRSFSAYMYSVQSQLLVQDRSFLSKNSSEKFQLGHNHQSKNHFSSSKPLSVAEHSNSATASSSRYYSTTSPFLSLISFSFQIQILDEFRNQ